MTTPSSQSSSESGLNRRGFLEGLSLGAVATAGLGVAGGVTMNSAAPAMAQETPAAEPKPAKLLVGEPVLQCPTSTGVSIVWQVSCNATGWIEYGPTQDLGLIAKPGLNGLNALSTPVLSARLEGLTPGVTTYYRVASAPIDFQNAYKIIRGETEYSPVHEFRLPAPEAQAFHWCVINDTHEVDETLHVVFNKVEEINPELLVWNGDIFNDIRTQKQLIRQTLSPAGRPYAAKRPVMFVSGNHDVRGALARDLDLCLLPRPDSSPLGRSFALRCGPVAMIGLDTGEDKADNHPVYAGLAQFEPYREAQGQWLEEALQRPEIASAPYVILHCHIPLFGNRRDGGPEGQVEFARFCEQGQKWWLPHLKKAGAQLVISGHTHRHRFMPVNENQAMAQLIGGAPATPKATVIYCEATAIELKVTALQMDGETLGVWTFKPRNLA